MGSEVHSVSAQAPASMLQDAVAEAERPRRHRKHNGEKHRQHHDVLDQISREVTKSSVHDEQSKRDVHDSDADDYDDTFQLAGLVDDDSDGDDIIDEWDDPEDDQKKHGGKGRGKNEMDNND